MNCINLDFESTFSYFITNGFSNHCYSLLTPGKASKILTDHLIRGLPIKSEPAEEKWLSQTIHTYQPYLFASVVIAECLDIRRLMLGKSAIKWRQHPDMTIAVDWGVKCLRINANKQTFHT